MKKLFYYAILIFYLVSAMIIITACTNKEKLVQSTNESKLETMDKIIFYSGRDGNNEIYSMNCDGTVQTNLTNNSHSDTCPSVYSYGNKIAFISDRDGNSEIYTMNIDGSDIKKLTESEEPLDQPSWSSDGEKIAFIKDLGTSTEIWLMNSDGTNQVRITKNPFRDERPIFSSDASKLLFMSNKDGKYKIYVMNSDGTNVNEVNTNRQDTSNHEIFPTWTSDNLQIAYSENNLKNREAQIFIYDFDKNTLKELTEKNGRSENPCFSPDNSQIVFQSERNGNFDIYTMNSDGTNVQRLTDASAWDGWAVWYSSPME